MKILLILVGLLSLLFGIFIFMNAKSAVHEIEALIAMLIFAVCTAGAGTIEAIGSAPEKRAKAELAAINAQKGQA